MAKNEQTNKSTSEVDAKMEATLPLSDQPAPPQSEASAWTIADSESLYHVREWGDPYFSINAAGHVTVSPQGDRGGSLDLYELVKSLRQRDLDLPLLVRFPDIAADRLERLHACFAKAIARYNYPGSYRGVFPIKCNHHRHLLEAIVEAGKSHQFGLEVGSKPELAIALSLLDTPGAFLICNGYKDREYIETALLATRLGHRPILVLEQPEEVAIVLEISQALDIVPILGMRAKLSVRGSGHWESSTGDLAKFGLTVSQMLAVVERLTAAGYLDSLQLLHFHLGSQISAIGVIKAAIREAAQLYVELAELGANMRYLDVGGGLAIDYDGSKTDTNASKNYDLQNYANDIVAEIKETCEQKNCNAPTLLSESGRAIAAHQSVLIFNILDSSDPPTALPPPASDADHLIIRNLWETYDAIGPENCQESYHDAIQFKEEARSLFSFGYLSLKERARAEQLYWACCDRILGLLRDRDRVTDDLKALDRHLASIYYANMSVFRSAPDFWAIEQLFPILPIHRLDEEPSQRAILADLTCDSDGRVDRFINPHTSTNKHVLELHSLSLKTDYYLGMFLVGAYQEIMGNLHNLFGEVNVAHVRMNPNGYQIEQALEGDAIADVLKRVQYDPEDLVETLRRRTERALQAGQLTLEQSRRLLQNYKRSLAGYTYLN